MNASGEIGAHISRGVAEKVEAVAEVPFGARWGGVGGWAGLDDKGEDEQK